MKYEKMLDFLLFGYFGCDGSDGADTMRNRAAHRAYLDLARTVNYRLSTSQLAEKLKKRSSEYEKRKLRHLLRKRRRWWTPSANVFIRFPPGILTPGTRRNAVKYAA